VDPVPNPLLLRKSGSAGNRTQNLWICSQKLGLDHRGSHAFLTSVLNEDVSFMFRPLNSRGTTVPVPLDRRLGGPQGRPGRGGEKETHPPPPAAPGIQSRSSSRKPETVPTDLAFIEAPSFYSGSLMQKGVVEGVRSIFSFCISKSLCSVTEYIYVRNKQKFTHTRSLTNSKQCILKG
jgi:hypothetical protein